MASVSAMVSVGEGCRCSQRARENRALGGIFCQHGNFMSVRNGVEGMFPVLRWHAVKQERTTSCLPTKLLLTRISWWHLGGFLGSLVGCPSITFGNQFSLLSRFFSLSLSSGKSQNCRICSIPSLWLSW